MAREKLGPILASLAVFARVLMVAAACPWTIVATAWVLGDDPERGVPLTMGAVVLNLVAGMIGIHRALKEPSGRARIAAGPGSITQWRPLVFAVGGASVLGGLLLSASGSPQMGGWGVGIGAAIVVFELADVVGAAVLAPADRAAGK